MCVCVFHTYKSWKIWSKDHESVGKDLGGESSIKLDLEFYYWLECEKEK